MTHVAEIQPCGGASMYPTLSHTGTFVLNSALVLRLFPVRRGELVTSLSPQDVSHRVLKRVIALEGDRICVDPSGQRPELSNKWCTVPKGSVWLAGDNTSNSIDSRDYGPVPLALLTGKVVARVSVVISGNIRRTFRH